MQADGELLLSSESVKDDRPALWVLQQQARVLKVRNQLLSSLDPCKRDLTHLFRIEPTPFLSVKRLVKAVDEPRLRHVDKRIPHVTLVLKVNRQVDKIKVTLVSLLQRTHQHLLVVLVGDVADHQRRPRFLTAPHPFQVQCKLCVMLRRRRRH